LATTLYWQSSNVIFPRSDYGRGLRLQQQADAHCQVVLQEQPGNVDFLELSAKSQAYMIAVTESLSARAELLRPLENDRVLLDRELQADPADTARRQRLAQTYLLLGELRHHDPALGEAAWAWQQAAAHYRQLAAALPGDLVVKFALVACYQRLLPGTPSEPCYPQAVALCDEIDQRLAALAKEHPECAWLKEARVQNQVTLMLCHCKASQPAQAEAVYQTQVRPLVLQAGAPATDPQQGLKLVQDLLWVANKLAEAKQPASLTVARQAAAVLRRYAGTSSLDRDFYRALANRSADLAGLLCRLGDPAEALNHAERGCSLYEELRAGAPDVPEWGRGLSTAWERVAKARWQLGQPDPALAAFRKAAAVQRQVFESDPSSRADRQVLSRYYDKLHYWNCLRGNRVEAAAALREREKLWPDDANQLGLVSRDFHELADMVGAFLMEVSSLGMLAAPLGQGPLLSAALCAAWTDLGPRKLRLTPTEEAERQHYLAESERTRRAAENAARRTGNPAQAAPGRGS
jgi:tetratricopeptide (TPR) repeat protein